MKFGIDIQVALYGFVLNLLFFVSGSIKHSVRTLLGSLQTVVAELKAELPVW